ncbi:putative C6 transcription factor [Aspergillus pseudoustus]|uniref:C6 transcription factor n=1 Tax=Aspergillus pseudoustus TaxID=1810923 RepID=A0ABR4JEY5_9EURO
MDSLHLVADQEPTTSSPFGDLHPPLGATKRRSKRNSIACDSCHRRRVRCGGSSPCVPCLLKNIQCAYIRKRRKPGRIPRSQLTDKNDNLRKEGAEEFFNTLSTRLSDSHWTRNETRPVQCNSPDFAFNCQSSTANALILLTPSPNIAEKETETILEQPVAEPLCAQDMTEEWLRMMDKSPDLDRILQSPGPSTEPYPGILTVPDGINLATPSTCDREAASSMGSFQTPGMCIEDLKYPVLRPLIPFVAATLPVKLLCDLLDVYFTSASPTHVHPVCCHIHCYLLRKASFLDTVAPRPSSPALLASMLWVAALENGVFSLPISPPQRQKLCRFLGDLAMSLLKPWNQNPANYRGAESDSHRHLDEVIAYIHIASIISSSEQKGASMRWWHAAFSLARELKLNQEITAISDMDSRPWTPRRSGNFHSSIINVADDRPTFSCLYGVRSSSLNCVCTHNADLHHATTEEHREERRRTWWLLYIMDRHLALCYNCPLALLDAECADLLLPVDETSWQMGRFHSNSPKPNGPQCHLLDEASKRRVFPDFLCRDHSIFGFFLPLMTIAGELVDFKNARNHPIHGSPSDSNETYNAYLNKVLSQLESYRDSLATFGEAKVDLDNPVSSTECTEPDTRADCLPGEKTHFTQASWHTQTVTSYASYLVQILHVLLVGKWDPVSILDDKDFRRSSPAFASAISHVIDASYSLKQILRFDPDISFMPFFFGIHLLQGISILLLIVECLQDEAGERIFNACETMIRATESCVVTLNTEYQRYFRQVLRSALARARGQPVNNHFQVRQQREAILALYRWTANGTGLAL